MDGVVGESGFSVPMRLPSTRIEYYNTDGGTRWRSTFDELMLGDDGFPVGNVGGLMSPWRTFKGGSTRQEGWNRPVFGPAFGQPAHDHEYVSRSGDAILVLPWVFGDSSGRAGYATLDEGRIALYRDGTLVGEVASSSDPAEFNVPAGSAAYRLTISGRRAAGAPSSTQVSGEWTFRSGHVNGARPLRLPLLTVTFAPNVDAHQSVPAGSGVLVPVSVAAQPGLGAGKPRSLVVAVSYDDGRTWQDAPVVGAADAHAVKIDHVAGAQFVSLRAKAADDRGNAVEQTILRAYRIAGSS